MSRRRVLLVGFLLLQVAALVCAGALAASDAERSNHGTQLHSELAAESLQRVQAQIALGAEADASAVPTKPEEIRVLPELPGSELLGVGLNLREGLDMGAMTRPIIRSSKGEWLAFALDSKSYYRIPATQAARRNFRADMVTKVFNSNQERLMDLAVSAGVEFELGMFSGSADAHVAITKQNDKKTMITQASLDVGLVDVSITRYTTDDLDPQFVAEWNDLPDVWADGPMQYQDFIKKWGTNYVRSADIGGAFEMVGTTTVAKDVDSLSVAANVKISLEMAIKVNAKGSVDYKSKNVNEQYQNNFDFHARGGDPAVGAMLASSQQAGGKDGKLEYACSQWLASLKKTPTIKTMKLGYIYELFGGFPGNGTARRQLAMKQAIDVFMREQDVSSNVISLREGKLMFSNFWRVTDQCLNFQAVIGPQNKLQVHLTSSARRIDLGYSVEIDMERASILKGGKVMTTTRSISAITPGSETLYSTYIVCYDSRAGTVLYGRGRRVVLAYKDPRPEAAYYYGFSATGKTLVSVTATQVFNVGELTCPVSFGKTCGGRGQCNGFRMCECDAGFLGFACQQECPLGAVQQQQQVGNETTTVTTMAVCSQRGQCQVDDSMGDSAQPFCVCKSGFLGQTCEINELPTLKLEVRPMGPDGQLLSGRPITFSLKRESSDGRAAAIMPQTTQFSFEEPNAAEAEVVKQPIAYRTLSAGTVTVTGSITLPNNPDTVRVTKTFTVLDCSCSGKGRCDGNGQCVCRAGASGANCEDDALTGMVTVPVSRLNTRTVTGKFTRQFGRVPKSVELSIYEAPENQQFSVTLASHTDRELTFVVTRTDSLQGWDSEIRVMYRAVGARYVGKSKGEVVFPPANGEVARSVAIRFPMPYGEAPFIHVRAAKSSKDNKALSGLQFRVLRSNAQGAVLEVSRDEGTWDQAIHAEWVARPIGARDFYQHGEFKVGARKEGPAPIHIEFPDVFRAVPTVELKAKSLDKAEIFDVRLIEITQAGIYAEVALISGATADAGWQQNLVIRWKAYPKGFDKSIVENAQSADFVNNYELVGFDIGTPIQLPPGADEKDCAMACAQEPSCKGFVFHKTVGAPQACQGEYWNGGNSDLAPVLVGVGARRLHVKTSLHGWWMGLYNTWSGDAWGTVERVIMLRDGRLLGVDQTNRLVLRRAYWDEWQIVPNSCCVIGVAELQDGRLAAVGTDNKLWVKQTAALTSGFVIKTGNHHTTDTRARSAEEMEQISAAREQEAFIEVESEVDSESDALKPKKAAKSQAKEAAPKTPVAQKSAATIAAENAKRARRPPSPTKRPRVSAADSHRVDDFNDITQLVDGTIVGLSTNQHLYTLRDPNGDWRNWNFVGSHSCCMRTVAAHPKGGVVGRGTNDHVYVMENSLADDWQYVQNSCCVSHVIATFPMMSRGVLSQQPRRCYLKSIRPTRSMIWSECAVSGSLVKRDDDGNVVNQPKKLTYTMRSMGWGDKCAGWHYNSQSVEVQGKRHPLVRGLNVYLIHATGQVEWAQADTGWNEARVTRGGGHNALRQLLDAAANVEQALKDGVIAVAVMCVDECTNYLPGDIRDKAVNLGYTSFRDAVLHSGGMFIKDLRNGGTVHADLTGSKFSCNNFYRYGWFEL